MSLPPTSAADFSIFTSARYDPALRSAHEHHPLYLLSYHHARLIAAARNLGFSDAAAYLSVQAPTPEALYHLIEKHFETTCGTLTPASAIRIRILLPPSGNAFQPVIESSAAAPLPLASFFPTTLGTPATLPPSLHRWMLYVLPHPVGVPAYPPAVHKTTARDAYTAARAELAAALHSDSTPLALDIDILLPVVLPHEADQDAPGMEISETTLATPYFFRGGSWVTPRAAAGGCKGTARSWALQKEEPLAAEARVPADGITVGERVWLSNGVRGFGWGVVQPWPTK